MTSSRQNEKKVAEALTRHVAIRTDSRRRCPLPDYLKRWIAALESA